jgi:hypothetical protein
MLQYAAENLQGSGIVHRRFTDGRLPSNRLASNPEYQALRAEYERLIDMDEEIEAEAQIYGPTPELCLRRERIYLRMQTVIRRLLELEEEIEEDLGPQAARSVTRSLGGATFGSG